MWRRPVFVIAVVLLAMSAPEVAPAPARAASGGCAWGTTSLRTNALFPDSNAAYWITPLLLWPGADVEVHGTFAQARYFSLQTYTIADGFSTTVGGVRDRDVAADPGSENPFAGPVSDGSGRDWTVTVATGDPTTSVGPNAIRGLPAGDAAGITWLMYRTYLTDEPADPTGAAGLPTVTVRGVPLWTCGGALAHAAAPQPAGPSTSLPVRPVVRDFFKAEGRLTPFPNEDNKYLAAVTAWAPGRVFSVRFKAASTPDTRGGDPVYAPADLRYWSVCQNGLPSTRVHACLADSETHPDAQGFVTVVISSPADRPDGVADWLAFGTDPIGVVAFRTMLPAEDFHHAVQDVATGADPTVAMGDYTPRIGSCTRDELESTGSGTCP